MNALTSRLRMFAGPNGSGKSKLKTHLPSRLLGIYLNPDEIEKEIGQKGCLDFSSFQVKAEPQEFLAFLQSSSLIKTAGLSEQAKNLYFEGEQLHFREVQVNSYFASAVADYFRQKLLVQKQTFTFETVMSHRSKVDLLKQAQRAGYRTYLYYIATEDPIINISRVLSRVAFGGHNVPQDKISQRYYASLDLLIEAIRHTNRAFIFDNSTDNQAHTWVAEITDGNGLEMKTRRVPAWFKRSVLDKIK